MKDNEVFRIPKDFQSRPEFRWLETEAGFGRACATLFVLWRELAYLSECQRLGFITGDQLARCIDREFRRPNGDKFESDPITCLVATRMLCECEGGYECRSFAMHNKHLTPEYKGSGKKGAFFSSIKSQRSKAERELSISTEFNRAAFVRDDGRPMEDVEFRRVVMVVRLLDNQYGRPLRKPSEFTPGMIADAYAASRKYTEAEFNGVCYWLHAKRDHKDPMIPSRTEDALRDFDRLVLSYVKTGKSKRDYQRDYERKAQKQARGNTEPTASNPAEQPVAA